MTSPTEARVTLLDGFSLDLPGSRRCADTDARSLPHGVQRLVAYVSLCRRPARTAIAGQLWPDVPEDKAHRSLRSALWRLQKVAPGLVRVSGGSLALAPGVRVDVRELTEWAQQVLDPRTDAAGTVRPDVGLRGELLPGWYDDWVLAQRDRLRMRVLHALEALGALLRDAGRPREAVEAVQAAVLAEPLRESGQRALIEAHQAAGDWVAARRQFDAFRILLQREIGVEPSAELTEVATARRR